MIDTLKNLGVQPLFVFLNHRKVVNNRIIVALAVVLVIALGIQAYMIFQLNNRLKQLSGEENQADSP